MESRILPVPLKGDSNNPEVYRVPFSKTKCKNGVEVYWAVVSRGGDTKGMFGIAPTADTPDRCIVTSPELAPYMAALLIEDCGGPVD